jgi:hypothetical protein
MRVVRFHAHGRRQSARKNSREGTFDLSLFEHLFKHSRSTKSLACRDRSTIRSFIGCHPYDLAGEEPSTEQGLRILGANLRDDDRPCVNPPYAKPDRPCVRLFKHPLKPRRQRRKS